MGLQWRRFHYLRGALLSSAAAGERRAQVHRYIADALPRPPTHRGQVGLQRRLALQKRLALGLGKVAQLSGLADLGGGRGGRTGVPRSEQSFEPGGSDQAAKQRAREPGA